MSRLLIFGGTTEGRLLAQALSQRGVPAAVSVATVLGSEELSGLPGITPLVGRKTAQEMATLLSGYDRCVDATHPYAQEVSANIRSACRTAGVPLRRLLRRSSELPPDSVLVGSPEEAARVLQSGEGNVRLAIGAKGVSAFSGLAPERLYPRVLPVEESLSACRRAGIPTKNIIAMHGPFSQTLNEAILEQYRIRWMVTKDGGPAGGFGEKAAAARNAGAALVVLGRPEDSGADLETVLTWLLQEDPGHKS